MNLIVNLIIKSLKQYIMKLIVSGIFGSLSLFYVLPFSIELNPLEDDSTLFYIISGGWAGVLYSTLYIYPKTTNIFPNCWGTRQSDFWFS